MSRLKMTAQALDPTLEVSEGIGEIIEKYQQLDKKIDDRLKKIKSKKQEKEHGVKHNKILK